MTALFVVNHRSGTGRGQDVESEIRRGAAENGVPAAIVHAGSGHDLEEVARAGISTHHPALVVACGGDGTVNAVARLLAGGDIPLGVLPLGTFNHFAKDAGIPLDVPGAIQTAFSGRAVPFDLGEVNGRIFLNNSSIGIYPRIVRYRNAERRKGRNKWLAFVMAIAVVMRRHGLFDVELALDNGQRLLRHTAFVFLGNNEYEKSGLDIGARRRLDGGRLWLCLPRLGGRKSLLRIAVLALIGRRGDADLESLTAGEVTIRTRKKRLNVAIDGEVCQLDGPLNYRLRRQALKVILPAAD
jgi:diacylglycerol kinase family enzyme